MTDREKLFGDALFDVAQEAGEATVVIGELRNLAGSFAEEPGFIDVLAARSLTREERCALIDDCFSGKLSEHTVNYLKVLAENDMIRSYQRCFERFYERYNESNGIIAVRAVSAAPVSEELRQKLEEKIRSITGKTPEITYVTDPKCIGGMLIEVDGTRFDGTVRKRLEEMRKTLVSPV